MHLCFERMMETHSESGLLKPTPHIKPHFQFSGIAMFSSSVASCTRKGPTAYSLQPTQNIRRRGGGYIINNQPKPALGRFSIYYTSRVIYYAIHILGDT